MPSSRRYYSAVGDDRKVNNLKLFSRWARQRKLTLLLIAVFLVALFYYFWPESPKEAKFVIIPRSDMLSEPTGKSKKSLTIKGKNFYLDGRPFQILSGSIHYFRVPRAYWRDRLSKLKAVGLNTVDTYVAWNMHEEQRGQFDFSGELDLVEFLSIARELGLHVILRPGPYICAEWDHGGLPAWLLSDSKMKIRTTYEGFTSAVETYFEKLFSKLKPLQYSNDGPIIAVQVENEYGAYGDDKEYLTWLKQLLIRLGVVEFLFTSDGPKDFERGYAPGVFETVNYNEKTEEALTALETFQPNKPLMTGEFWPGWFDHWSEKHHVMLPDDLMQRLEPSFKRNASINFYMFHGGTNFGFMNGANLKFHDDKPKKKEGAWKRFISRFMDTRPPEISPYAAYQPTITSYDYDSPLNEFGGKTEKYEKLRRLIQHYQAAGGREEVDAGDPWSKFRSPVSYGQFNVQSYLPLTNALDVLQPLSIDLEKPLFVELVQADSAHQLHYGFVAYRTTIAGNAKKIALKGVLADRMQVVVNGKTVATFLSNLCYAPFHEEIDLSSQLLGNGNDVDLVLLVENMGRANYAKRPHSLDGMFKGFNGTAIVDSPTGLMTLSNWKIYSIRFRAAADLQKLVLAATAKAHWKPVDQTNAIEQPAFYKADVDIPAIDRDLPDDTFINMKDWTKGVVYANGVNLGRYWNVGPQQTLYLPGPWLKKGSKNEIVIFETGQSARSFALQSQPSLGEPCPMPCYP